MLSYLHRFHAGNFADIHKHLTLIAILQYLQKKEKPFAVLDTHAGDGYYDLRSKESKKLEENKQGFKKLLADFKKPALVKSLLSVVAKMNPDNAPRFYPGSPKIIESFLRKDDHAHLVELHPSSFLRLKEKQWGHNTHLHERDAMEALKAIVPFKEKRGLIFMDPSYEVKTEYQTIAEKLIEAIPRFPQAYYALWYPILKGNPHLKLLQKLKAAEFEEWCVFEWVPDPEQTEGMMGSGMVLINPPFSVPELLFKTFKELEAVFPGAAFRRFTPR